MAENFIQLPPNSSGEKVRAFKNTVGPDDVNSQAMTIVDAVGNIMANLSSGRLVVDGSGVTQPVSDAGGSLTVDAPVATPLFTRLSDGTSALTTTGGRLSVDASGVAVPVTDDGGSLTVDSPQLPAALSGGRLDVTLGTAIPTGTNSIGVLGANDGVDIGDVTINNAAGASAVNIQDGGNSITVDGSVSSVHAKAEDTVAADADLGIPILAVRNDAAVAKTSANGDYSMLATDSAGRLGIADLGGSITVDGTVVIGATVTPGTGATNLGKAEDAAHTSGNTGVFILGVRNDTDTAFTSADNDYSPIAVDSAGRIKLPTTRAEDAAHASGDVGTFVLGVRNDTAATTTSADGDYSQIATDSAGRVGISDLGGAISVDDNGGSLTVDGTVTAAAQPGVDIGDVTINNAAGASAVNIQDGGNSITVDGTVTAAAQPGVDIGDVTINNAAGAAAVNIQDGGNSITVDVGTALPTGTNTVGNVGLVPTTAGGLSLFRDINVGSTGQLVKGSAGQIYNIVVSNNATAVRYLKLYNKATAPTVGTDTPVMTIRLSANPGGNGSDTGPIVIPIPQGLAFPLGIGVGAVTGVADANTTNTAANDVIVHIMYA